MRQPIVQEDRLPTHSFREVRTAMAKGDLERLQWGNHRILGSAILVAMPDRGYDLVIARTKGLRTPRYEVFAAGTLPETTLIRNEISVLQAAHFVELYFDKRGHSEQDIRDWPLNEGDLEKLLEDVKLLTTYSRGVSDERKLPLGLRKPSIGSNWVDAIATRSDPAGVSQPGRAP